MNNESLLLSFFNQYLFNEAKQNIEHIEYFYYTNPSTNGNPLISELINAIKTYNLDAIGEPLFRSILLRCQKTPQETDQIMQELLTYKRCSKEQIAPAAKDMRNIISAAIINKANNKYKDDPSGFLKHLKDININTGDATIFSATSLDKIDINSIVAESKNSTCPTNVDLINRAYASSGFKLPFAQLIVVAATPGSGKTLFTMNLALWFASAQNKRVLYISLADQTEVDFITRCKSIISGCTFAESYRDIQKSYNDLVNLVGSNLEISINSAGNVSAQQIVDLARERDADVVIVDYDSCVKTADGRKADDSMYNALGDTYNKMTELSLEDRRLVIMCSQLKSYSNQNGSLIGLNDLAESSKKGQIVDAAICMSKISGESPNQVFNIRFTKCRRGKLASGFFVRIQARFIEIPRGLAEQLCAEMEDRDYTEQQIQAMAVRYKQNENSIQQSIKQEQQRRHDNPFT